MILFIQLVFVLRHSEQHIFQFNPICIFDAALVDYGAAFFLYFSRTTIEQ